MANKPFALKNPLLYEDETCLSLFADEFDIAENLHMKIKQKQKNTQNLHLHLISETSFYFDYK